MNLGIIVVIYMMSLVQPETCLLFELKWQTKYQEYSSGSDLKLYIFDSLTNEYSLRNADILFDCLTISAI